MGAVTVRVEAYDVGHKNLLFATPRSQKIAALLASGLVTTEEEILLHAMFSEQKDHTGYRTFRELATRAATREAKFREYFALTGGKICASFAPAEMEKPETERLGVACAILALNRIMGITEADWTKIPETSRSKTLDHQWQASDGSGLIRVEAKGTVSESVRTKGRGASRAKRSIDEKKRAVRGQGSPGGAKSEEYGSIMCVSATGEDPILYLLDPPGERESVDPVRERLLSRLRYYLLQMRMTRRFRMLIALRNRIAAIERHAEYSSLDGLALVDDTGEPFALSLQPRGDLVQVVDGRAAGRLLVSEANYEALGHHPFVGFDPELFGLIASQDFAKIVGYRREVEAHYALEKVGLFDEGGVLRKGSLEFSINSAGIAYGGFS